MLRRGSGTGILDNVGLDAKFRGKVIGTYNTGMERRRAREGHTFLSSPDAQEIRPLCSHISVLAKGRLVYDGPTRELGADLDAFEERLIELLERQGEGA